MKISSTLHAWAALLLASLFAFTTLTPPAHARDHGPFLEYGPTRARPGPVRIAGAATPCEEFIASLPPGAIHGTVNVPEDWSRPDSGPTISVFYYGFNVNEHPDRAPVAYFNGGPGASVHGLYKSMMKKPQFAEVPFVFIDQRGTGCSSPLPGTGYTREDARRTALYGARATVLDAEAIRKSVFGPRKWRVFGQSYGSLIVHRYVELAPEGLLAAYAHGMALMQDSILWTEMRASAYKRVGDVYFADGHAGDREIINRARRLFPDDYCIDGPDYRVCGNALLDDLGWSNLSFKDYGTWNTLHDQIGKLLREDGSLNMEFIRTRWPSALAADPATSLLVDIVPGREAPGGFCNTWSCALAVPSLEAKGEQPLDWEFNECRNALHIERKYDYSLTTDVVAEDYPSLTRLEWNLRRYPDLKFFLYSGELDTFAPFESFAEEVKFLGPRIRYRAFASGHGSYFEEPKVWEDLFSTQ